MRDKNSRKSTCVYSGPGPQYLLPTLIGYIDHDMTKWRYPAYTMAPKYPAFGDITQSPGPKYKPPDGVYHDGKDLGITWAMSFRNDLPEIGNSSPGPKFLPKIIADFGKQLPSISSRMEYGGLKSTGPGPNYVPPAFGSNSPTYPFYGMFSLSGRHDSGYLNAGYVRSPGPAAHDLPLKNPELISGYKSTHHTIATKLGSLDLVKAKLNAGPASYAAHEVDAHLPRAPKWAIGERLKENCRRKVPDIILPDDQFY